PAPRGERANAQREHPCPPPACPGRGALRLSAGGVVQAGYGGVSPGSAKGQPRGARPDAQGGGARSQERPPERDAEEGGREDSRGDQEALAVSRQAGGGRWRQTTGFSAGTASAASPTLST